MLVDGIKNVVMHNTDMNIKASAFGLYFVTNLINANEPVPPVIFTKPFFHAIYHLLLGMKLTNTSTLSPSFREALLASFTTFRATFDPPTEESTEPRQPFCSKLSSPVGRPAVSLTGSVLSSTADENVTAWKNHVVDNFQGFATTYLQADLQRRLHDVTRSRCHSYALYVYEKVAADPKFVAEWPEFKSVKETLLTRIRDAVAVVTRDFRLLLEPAYDKMDHQLQKDREIQENRNRRRRYATRLQASSSAAGFAAPVPIASTSSAAAWLPGAMQDEPDAQVD
ncbi:hypothetical protein DM01DRAFT_1159088 [Hesseltinella vesiculosa]|uniref:Uncharacterized protein n=1 Tax=Hesseltinella vesiculosa TaxID=101127 RepID=A0A1X2GS49_9FUNG|nr:hypothetical protein DM01DRAFT_1159088 [Hesseltinella vesiculosa]